MTVEHVLAIIGAIVPVFSAIASALNQHARTAEAPSAGVAKAQVVVNALALDLEGAYPGTRVFVQHRTGTLQIGDLAVVVAVSSPHRKDAFVVCEATIDRLKQEAPIWKREHGNDGVSWVGTRP